MKMILQRDAKSFTNATSGNVSVTMRSTPKNNRIDLKSNRIFMPSEGLTLASPKGSKLSDYNEQQLKLPDERNYDDRTVTEQDEPLYSPKQHIAVGQSNEAFTEGSIDDSDHLKTRHLSNRGFNSKDSERNLDQIMIVR